MDFQKLQEPRQKLQGILAKRKNRPRQYISGSSKALLKQDVLQFIDHHYQFDSLLHEAKKTQLTDHSEQTSISHNGTPTELHDKLSASCCISYLEAQAQTTRVPLATLAANMCVAKIDEILRQQEGSKLLHLNPDQNVAIEPILELIEMLKDTQSFHRKQFVKLLNAKGPIPLELLWRLHVKSIVTFDIFITSNLGMSSAFTSFTDDVAQCALACVTDTHQIFADILADTVQFLIGYGYASQFDVEDPPAAAVQKACMLLLDTIVGKILDSGSFNTGASALARLLQVARINQRVPADCLARFFSRQLAQVLSHKANITVKDAVESQEQWSFARAPSGVTDMYRQLLLTLECKEAMDIIQRVLEREEVNWRSLLTFSATLLVYFQNAPTMLKDMIDSLLSQSLESCEQDSLIAAFLLARQSAIEGPHVFPPYAQWFRDHFGESSGSSLLTNKKTVGCFLAFLTSLVPHEPAPYLKAHLKNQPHIPAKSKESLADYNSLAKTRLADLMVSLDSEGVYDSTSASSSTGINQSGRTQIQDQALEDVDKAVTAFEKTGRIPTNVLEASIFRRPYYIGRFLPALLTPRMLPDMPDYKMKFIEELKRSDKIPASMLQHYVEACAKEVSSLLDGAFTDDATDDCLEPIDALNVSLEKMPTAVLNSLQSQNASAANDVAQHISVISDRLGTVLDSFAQQLGEKTADADCVILDFEKPTQNIHAQHMQVVDMFLGSFCKTCLAVNSLDSEPGTGNGSALWASQMVAMLSKHRPIHVALYHRLWNLSQEQGYTLSSPHISGIAVFLVHLEVKRHLFPPVFISGPVGQQIDGSLLHHISRHLQHHSKQWMIFTLRFSSEVIEHVLKLDNHMASQHGNPTIDSTSLISRDVVKNFSYLLPRLCDKARSVNTDGFPDQLRWHKRMSHDDTWAPSLAIYHTDQWKQLVQQYAQMTVKEWVGMEMQVEPHMDGLTDIERQDYYRWVMHGYFLTRPIQDGGCGGSYSTACTIVLEAILDFDEDLSSLLRSRQLTCCHSNQRNDLGRERRNGCRSEIIQLLQEMIPSLCSSSSDDPSPWLLSIINNRLKQCDNNQNDEQIKMACFLRLACSLPVHLLFSLNPSEIPNKDNVTATLNFMNMHLRSYEQEDAYGLPLMTTSYITRALLHFFHQKSSRQDASNFTQSVLQGCPLLPISLLIHWPKLWPIISSTCGRDTPTLFKQLNTLYQWAIDSLHHHGNPAQKESTIEGSILETEPWLLAIALVAVGMGENGGARREKEKRMLNVIEFVRLKRSLPDKVSVYVIECLLANMAWDVLAGHTSAWNAESLTSIWIVPHILSSFKDDTVLKQTILRACISRMFCLIFFRLLLSTRAADIADLSMSTQFAHTLLQMHAALTELHCHTAADEEKQDVKDANNLTAPLSLDFHLACTKYVHDYITRCPPRILHSLPPSVLSICNTDIAAIIKGRLKITSI